MPFPVCGLTASLIAGSSHGASGSATCRKAEAGNAAHLGPSMPGVGPDRLSDAEMGFHLHIRNKRSRPTSVDNAVREKHHAKIAKFVDKQRLLRIS
jgi:hypothetical protein